MTLPAPTTVPFDFDLKPRECHWCDQGSLNGPLCTNDGPHPHPVEIPQLELPINPTTLAHNTTYYVDGENPLSFGVNDPPLWVDKVDPPTNIVADPNMCAENFLGASPEGLIDLAPEGPPFEAKDLIRPSARHPAEDSIRTGLPASPLIPASRSAALRSGLSPRPRASR